MLKVQQKVSGGFHALPGAQQLHAFEAAHPPCANRASHAFHSARHVAGTFRSSFSGCYLNSRYLSSYIRQRKVMKNNVIACFAFLANV